ncbi:MAG: uroporphyrinogen-III C-methyltransferase [Bacillota bacterium]|nr:uroporphyrinogen-III C-methyltransferase [Bacillota bacterium]
MNSKTKGIVYLVGAGPGSPDLITLRGLQCIKRADLIVYDRLVSPRLLQQAKKEAEFIYVGKMPDRHTMSQEEINRLLVEKAMQGLVVTRLKGGDPFVFGRGGEEAALLAENELPFEIVPGISSSVAVPAYAGIPVTHRGLAAGFTVVTGHEDLHKEESDLNWQALAQGAGTLIILMGMGNLPEITARLMLEGMSGETPAALVHRGTEASQRTLTATLRDLALKAEQENFKHPAVIIIGEVVTMREQLQWFENRPLFGRRIVVSRAREQASAFAEKLEALGAETIEFPVIKIAPPDDYSGLDRCLNMLQSYRFVIFTSENGVNSFFNRLAESGRDIRDLKGASICAIGPKTKEALELKGLRVDCVPSEYRAEAVVELLKERIVPGDKVLLPRADLARPVLAQELEKLGAVVDNVTAYRTVRGDGDVQLLRRLLKAGEIDMITFTSSSTVRNLVEMLTEEGEHAPASPSSLFNNVLFASIGPITSKTAADLGLKIAVEAKVYTIDGLTEAILSCWEEN